MPAALYALRLSMKHVLFLTSIVFSAPLITCERFEIPIELHNEYGIKPTEDRQASYEVRAPIEYKGWKISGAAYESGRSVLPLAMARDYENNPNIGLFFVRLTKNLAEKGKIIVSYTPIPESNENGEVTVAPCLHTQEISFGI